MDGIERRRRGGKKTSGSIRRRLVNALVDKIEETCEEEQPEALALEIAELDRVLVEANALCKDSEKIKCSNSREFLIRVTPEHVKLVKAKEAQ